MKTMKDSERKSLTGVWGGYIPHRKWAGN